MLTKQKQKLIPIKPKETSSRQKKGLEAGGVIYSEPHLFQACLTRYEPS